MKYLLSNLIGSALCLVGIHKWLSASYGKGRVCVKCGKTVVKILLLSIVFSLCGCATKPNPGFDLPPDKEGVESGYSYHP